MRFFIRFVAVLLACYSVAAAEIEDGATKSLDQQKYGAAPGERILKFPKDRRIGDVFIADWENGVLNAGKDSFQKLGAAQGDVTIPAGKQVLLGFLDPKRNDKPVDLSPLDMLQPTDLQGLYTPFAEISVEEAIRLKRHQSLRILILGPLSKVTDGCLGPLAELSALEILEIPETEVTDEGLKSFQKLTNLKRLRLYGTKVTGPGLAHLKDLTQLRILDLGHTQVDDQALPNLKNMKRLEYLSLWGTRVTDAGLVHLEHLTRLKHLHLGYGPQITDAGVEHLMRLTDLEWLELGDTDVTEEGRVRLKKALPKLTYVGSRIEKK